MTIRIAIVDDHPTLLKGLQSMLGSYAFIEITGLYLNGEDLLKDLTKNRPDIVMLDIQMPGYNGEELAGKIQELHPELKILVFTNMEHAYYVKSMIGKGIHGYLLKSSKETVILEAIESVYGGKSYFDTAVISYARQALRPSPYFHAANPYLTKREKEILLLIAANISSKEIAQKLFITKKTVDFHRANLMIKLEAKNAAALVKKAIDLGLLK